MSVYRVYVEKKAPFAVEAQGVLSDIRSSLGIHSASCVRILNRYDVEDISKEDFELAKGTIFSEPQVDDVYDELPSFAAEDRVFAVQFLPGQFDQRADSAVQCIQLATQHERPTVASAKVYVISGVSDEELARIKAHLINPVESMEASMELTKTLHTPFDVPADVAVLEGFCELDQQGLQEFIDQYGLAMDLGDITFCQKYFKETEKRTPTITEIRMIDTYWSDHCRHTTFSTNIEQVDIESDYVKDAYNEYLELRKTLHAGKNKPMTLMDLATIGAKALKKKGLLSALDESEEINACSVKIKVDIDGKEEEWLLQFKNETHNHPTEIEPFGGAATCLGGAIRDPLSGRAYIYQAMRVTGAGDPLTPFEQTIKGKLPQKKIVTTAAAGYSSYGNQIGLATGQVNEIYHPGYVAKRMEVGAVVGAVPACNVVREEPAAGDVIILLGGKTGRDGCGGATGSSKSHNVESLSSCGAEVQKGNPPEERKIQRLFRNGDVTRMIKRCNDFGAGGVSVAIGELADGLEIDLDLVPKKYDGLDGTELAISESQERMAVVVAKEDAQKFLDAADRENLMATVVAKVTEQPRLVMFWRGKRIVDLSREFLGSNGAAKYTKVIAKAPAQKAHCCKNKDLSVKEKFETIMADLNVCSQRGLSDRFDSTIGANTVVMPYGGKTQLTPSQAMVAKIPMLHGETNTCSIMSWGFNPYISDQDQFKGAQLAVVESIAKIIASGGSRSRCWLSFQEYFEKIGTDPEKWGKPFQSLLGGLKAQLELGCAAIGGKDSMSGSFEDIHVPPTLISFAVSTAKVNNVVTDEFKAAGDKVYLLAPEYDENGMPIYENIRKVFDHMESLIASGKVKAVYTLGMKGLGEALCKMSFGNRIGFAAQENLHHLFKPVYGAFVFEASEELDTFAKLIGCTTEEYTLQINGETVDLQEIQQKWEATLEPVYPRITKAPQETVPTYNYQCVERKTSSIKLAQPRVLIPVFPGTNCEYDTARAFERAGAKADIVVIRNKTSEQIKESVELIREKIANSQIIAIPGGFSGGDEPEGSAKFIASFFRNPQITEAVMELLKNRDGLMCGICNGFQALVKLGLVPYGEIISTDASCPTLTYNVIDRHQSGLVRTRIASNKSPWLMHTNVGDIHTIAISHGEGRFVASEQLVKQLAENGQIATQYVDLEGNPTEDYRFNPNGSIDAIEGITSPDGRIFGKMGHSERYTNGLYLNVDGDKDQKMFAGAVSYFRD
ncbi:phosphoribosylformylglycinamidine synthase [Clostridium sp. CAG:169]|nr:phosphoribosylformylglycinamidine synthase [Clostridium sp. CAG:169]